MIDTKYFKLLKDYPNRNIGDLVLFDEDVDGDNYLWNDTHEILPWAFEPNLQPDWFELCLFVTEDGVPIFKFDTYYYITGNMIFENMFPVAKRDSYLNKPENKRFSTNESAEAYLKQPMKFDTYLCRPQCCTILSLSLRTNVDSSQFKNVTSLGNSKNYGEVYKCWDNDESEYILFFGSKS